MPGLAPGSSDIFTAAAVLSQGARHARDDMHLHLPQGIIHCSRIATAGEGLEEDEDEVGEDPEGEMVDRHDFIQLCEAMLDKAQRQLIQMQQAIQRG